MNKKILLIPNMPHWSLDKTACDIIKYNDSDIEFDNIYYDEFIKNWEDLYDKYDLLYPMTNRLVEEFILHGVPLDNVITMISSFVSWDKG